MNFESLSEITKNAIKKELDKKHVKTVKQQAKDSGYTVDYDVEVGADGESMYYVTLNLNYINPDGEYVESDEILAVEAIPAGEVFNIDLIEEIMQEIGKDIV